MESGQSCKLRDAGDAGNASDGSRGQHRLDGELPRGILGLLPRSGQALDMFAELA